MKSTWFSLVVPRVLHVRDRRFVSQVRQDVTTRYVVGNRVVSRLFWVVSGKRALSVIYRKVGEMPSRPMFEEKGRFDIARAVSKSGGAGAIAPKLGLREPKRRNSKASKK